MSETCPRCELTNEPVTGEFCELCKPENRVDELATLRTLHDKVRNYRLLPPSPPARYLAAYPDVAAHAHFGNTVSGAWEHYNAYGRREGRVWPEPLPDIPVDTLLSALAASEGKLKDAERERDEALAARQVPAVTIDQRREVDRIIRTGCWEFLGASQLPEDGRLKAMGVVVNGMCKSVEAALSSAPPEPAAVTGVGGGDVTDEMVDAFCGVWFTDWNAFVVAKIGSEIGRHAVDLCRDKIRRGIKAAIAATPGPAPAGWVSQAATDVLAERRRQVEAEGWTSEHDDEHDKREMARAAACYALTWTLSPTESPYLPPPMWPWSWSLDWWKPEDPRRNLIKAGALILAEVERIDRANPPAHTGAQADGSTEKEG